MWNASVSAPCELVGIATTSCGSLAAVLQQRDVFSYFAMKNNDVAYIWFYFQEGEEIPLEVSGIATVPLLLHNLPTSGVFYFDVALPLGRISYEELPLVAVLARMLTESGAGDLSMEQLQHRIGEATGGIRAYVDAKAIPEVPLRVPNSKSARAFLIISGKVIDTVVHGGQCGCRYRVTLVACGRGCLAFDLGQVASRLL